MFLMTFGLAGLLLFTGSVALLKSDNRGFLLIGFGLVFLTIGILAVRHYMQLFNQIRLNEGGIEIKGLLKHKTYKWSEVQSVNLTGKEYETFMFMSMPMEAISIQLKGAVREIILVKFYSNMDRIRTALHFVNLRLTQREEITSDCFIQVQRQEPLIEDTTSLEKYSGNHLLTMNGLVAHGSWVFVGWLFLFSDGPMNLIPKAVFSFFILAFCIGLFGYQLHYFKLSEQFLIVKNHVWLWKNDAYHIKDLREVVFEEPHKMSTSLRIITNNYETKLYPAGSIKNKSWSRLCKKFGKMGIQVRNEAFFD